MRRWLSSRRAAAGSARPRRPPAALLGVLRAQLAVLRELAARYEVGAALPPAEGPLLDSPAAVAALLQDELASLPQEQVRALLLNTRGRLLRQVVAAYGSLNAAQVRPADLFREAVRDGAAAVILTHNHPSGDPTPSQDDLAFTRAAREAGRLLAIELLDHVVIARATWTSIAALEHWASRR